MPSTTVKSRRKAPTKALALKAVTDEQSRRAKPRTDRGKPSTWVFSAMTNADLAAVADGTVTKVTYKSGRVEHVGLKAVA